METSNFDLRQSVDDYIRRIKNQGSITVSDATELSAHLHDAIDTLKNQGLSEEEAFMIASKRLGDEEVLTMEYAKVNPSIITSKIWAYMFIGFNALYTIPSIILIGIAFLYFNVYAYYGDSNTSALIINSFNILFIIFIWTIVKRKHSISRFIERLVTNHALYTVLLSFIPYLLLRKLWPLYMRLRVADLDPIVYPMYRFHHNDLTEFTFYAAIVSIFFGLLNLVFSINTVGAVDQKTLFKKPSPLLLILFGVTVELLAASTRSLNVGSIWISAMVFGVVYLIASLFLTYQNKQYSVDKYLILFALFGFIVETAVGINADMSRTESNGQLSYNTIYFVSALISGVLIGRLLGKRAEAKILTTG